MNREKKRQAVMQVVNAGVRAEFAASPAERKQAERDIQAGFKRWNRARAVG